MSYPAAAAIIIALSAIIGPRIAKRLRLKERDVEASLVILAMGLVIGINQIRDLPWPDIRKAAQPMLNQILGVLAVLLWGVVVFRERNKIAGLQADNAGLHATVEGVEKSLVEYITSQSNFDNRMAEGARELDDIRASSIKSVGEKLDAVDVLIRKLNRDLEIVSTDLKDVPSHKEFEERLGNLLEYFDRESRKRINDAIKPVAQRLASMRGTWLNALIPCPAQRRCSGAKALPRKEHYYLPGAALQKEPGLSVVPTDDPTGQIYVCPTCYMDIVGIAPDSDPRAAKVS